MGRKAFSTPQRKGGELVPTLTSPKHPCGPPHGWRRYGTRFLDVLLTKQLQEGWKVGKKAENAAFCCNHCYKQVDSIRNGSYRNHCPFCLGSCHVDVKPGDRKSSCQGFMVAKGAIYKPKKGWQIVHECQICKVTKVNIIAPDDNWEAIVRLS